MSYKTILVHLENESQATHLLSAAVRLAGQQQSHLVGVYVAHTIGAYTGRTSEAGISAEIAQIMMKNDIEQAGVLEALFEKATNAMPFVSEWRFDNNLHSSVAAGVLQQARSADVVVVSTDIEPAGKGFDHQDIAPIIMNCSCPAVVVPESYQDKTLGEYVFIAWDGSRESSRAAFDALPLLKNAKKAWLHRVKSDYEHKQYSDDATRSIADALARHGVDLEISDSVTSSRKVGEEILTCASDRGADCIVMGAFGHSRLHGILLGDTTRFLVRHSSVPLVMSH